MFRTALLTLLAFAALNQPANAQATQFFVPASPYQTSQDAIVFLGDVPLGVTCHVVDNGGSLFVSVNPDSPRFISLAYTVWDAATGISSQASVAVDRLTESVVLDSTATDGEVSIRFVGEASTESGLFVAAKTIFKGDPENVKSAEELLEELKKNASKEILEKLKEIEDSGITIIVVKDDTGVIGGSYNDGKIDIGDINSFPDDGGARTDESALLHELVEQYEKQINKEPFDDAHKTALEAEETLIGSDYVKQVGPVRNADGTVSITTIWTDKDGNTIEQVTVYDPKTGKITVTTTNKGKGK
jgi:hypothetical protein